MNLLQEWRDNPPVATLKRFVDAHIVDRQVLLFHSLVINNAKCGTQRLRCYSGTHQFAGAKTQDIICAIPSKLPVHKRKEWQWNPRADATAPSESFEVGRLTKLLKVHVNPSHSTGFDVRELNLVYVSWMER